jgi:hypothetical protein
MTSSYKHRFARTFHQISRDNPELPLGQRFAMANLQIREAKLTSLIAELESYRRPESSFVPASVPRGGLHISAGAGPALGPFVTQIPDQWKPKLAEELLRQPTLDL